MKTSEQIAKVFKIFPPLKRMDLTQGFGDNFLSVYKDFGMKGHDALDIRALLKTPCYACVDGFVSGAGYDTDGGGYIKIETKPFEVEGEKIYLEFLYYHLDSEGVDVGKWYSRGDLLGLTGNTGRYTTGPHLHFRCRLYWWTGTVWKYDGGNGFIGAIDPAPMLDPAPHQSPQVLHHRSRRHRIGRTSIPRFGLDTPAHQTPGGAPLLPLEAPRPCTPNISRSSPHPFKRS